MKNKLTISQTKLVSWLLFIGMVFIALGITRESLFYFLSPGKDIYSFKYLVRLGPYIIFFASLIVLVKNKLNHIQPFYKIWLIFIVIYTIFMGFIGIKNSVSYHPFLTDTETMLLFLSGIIIGSNVRYWKYIDKAYLSIFVLGIFITLAGMTTLNIFSREETTTSLIYRTQYLLAPITFFIMTWDIRKKISEKIIISFTFCLYFFEQLIFQKRAPSIRLILALLLFLLLFPATKLFNKQTPKRIALSVITIIILIFFSMSYSMEIKNSYSGLVTRISQSRSDTYRFEQMEIVYENMNTFDKIFGRGLGGYIIDSRLTAWEISVDDTLVNGKTEIEIGNFWYFFKGGFVFLVIFLIGIISMIFSYKKALSSPLKLYSWSLLLIFFVFQMIEGFWGSEMHLFTLLTGLCVGAFIIRSNNNSISSHG